MNKEVRYWKWKSTIIDFNAISDEELDYDFHPKKKEWVFRYLGIPDNDIHEWYNGGFSSEYNRALKYAKELGLVEDYIDYDDIIYDLKQQLEQRDNIINKAKEYNKQIIKDTKDFYRPTSDRIYSGDCLIDLAEQNIKILDNKGE